MPHIAYIGLGSNIKPNQNLRLALTALAKQCEVLAVSSAWRSQPVGSEGPQFLNAVARISTARAVEDLKENVLRPIEAQLGRVRGADRFAPRTIDLDILLYDDEEIDGEVWDFAYIAVPLSELYPEYLSRVTGETIREAAGRLQENQPMRLARLVLSA